MPENAPALPAKRGMRILFYVIAGLMTAVVLGAFLLQRGVRVGRAGEIRATAGEVFAEIESLKKWEAWGPWFQRDPFLEKAYTGPESGTGAMLAWSSKKEGDGKV